LGGIILLKFFLIILIGLKTIGQQTFKVIKRIPSSRKKPITKEGGLENYSTFWDRYYILPMMVLILSHCFIHNRERREYRREKGGMREIPPRDF